MTINPLYIEVGVRITSDSIAPDQITAALGLSPSRAIAKGESISPKARAPVGVSRCNKWRLSRRPVRDCGDSKESEEVLALLSTIDAQKLSQLRAIAPIRVELLMDFWADETSPHSPHSLTRDAMALAASLVDEVVFICYDFVPESIVAEAGSSK